jgi:purine-binding chemotaxis protein CheW
MEQRAALGAGSTQVVRETQYLTFSVGTEEYGVDILRVQEIKGQTAITPIPNAPASIKGVMNLRGTVVPVIGLRETFGMEPRVYDKFSVIIVMTVGPRAVGVLVDAVSDVVNLKLSDIELAPEFGNRIDMSLIEGMARSGDKFIIILAIEKVVAGVNIKTEAGPPAPAEAGGSPQDRSFAA